MNIYSLLTPKQDTGWIYFDFTLRQTIEKMKLYGYTSMPIVDGDGLYLGIISEGDILKELKEKSIIDNKDLENHYIINIPNIFNKPSLLHSANEEEIIEKISNYNFVPIVDDRGAYMGIITRKSIILSLYNERNKTT